VSNSQPQRSTNAPAGKTGTHQGALARRTTPKLAAHGFCAVPLAFLEHAHRLRTRDGKRLNASEVLLIVNLLSFKWGEAMPFPSVESLAQRMGMGDRAVRKMLTRLHEAEIVERVQRGKRASNRYDMSKLFAKLEGFMDTAPEADGEKPSEAAADDETAAEASAPAQQLAAVGA